MAKDGKPQGAEDRALSEADPDILAIRALMEAQEIDIAPKVDDAPMETHTARQPDAPLAPPPEPDTKEIKAAIDTMITEAKAAPEDEPSSPEAAGPRSDGAPRPPGATLTSKTARFTRVLSLLGTFSVQVLRHPQTPRVAGVALLIVAFVLRPVLMIILALFAILAAAVVYFSVGPEAVDNYILRRFEALRKRDPKKADQLRGQTVRGISMLNTLIDRLPDRWTAGLYLPDLEAPVDPPEKMQEDPFDRLEPVAGGQRVIRKAATTEPVLPPDPRERKASPSAASRRPPRQIRP
ncbi:hypothetical protein [Aliiroseovarius crassostreae]|uniref:hypothetical protein n=1 Tax=Aliiroseovarius crassostreae TaxID=154981 RepID=UPI003C7A6CF1